MLVGRPAQLRQVGRGPATGIHLAIPVRRRVIIEMILVMRFQVGHEQEKRVGLVLVEVADDRVGLGINPVTGQEHLAVVPVVHHRAVGIRGVLENVRRQPEIVPAPFRERHRILRGEVPFTDVTGPVPGRAEFVCQRSRPRRERNPVAVTTRLGGIQAGLQTGPRRTADRLAGE